jgi:hypothetical protein
MAASIACAIANAQSPVPAAHIYEGSTDWKLIRSPLPIATPEADMPDAARRLGENGACVLTIIVDAKGLTEEPKIVRCTDSIFAEASLRAAAAYKFKPATTIQDGKSVPCRMHLVINFRIFGINQNPVPTPHIRVGFLVSQQPTSAKPDSNGIYALSRVFDPPNTFPKLDRFVNAGFGRAAFPLDDGAGCIVALTIHETGKASDVQITRCDKSTLEKPVIDSLLGSKYSPATLNGKPVPVRASMHLVCTGFDTVTK